MKSIELKKEDHREALRQIRVFFAEAREEEISDFQADALLTFFLGQVGPGIYNQALADAHTLITQKLDDLYSLEKRILPAGKKTSRD